MDWEVFFESHAYTLGVLPLLIFGARVLDVSLGTMRIIFVSRGKRKLAPIIGFIEVLIWISIMREIMQGVNNPISILAYASGFAVGNYVGMLLENKLAIGLVSIRIITVKDPTSLVSTLRAAGYGTTIIDAWGGTGPAKILYTIIRRKNLPKAVEMIQGFDVKCFFSVEDIKSVREGVFPVERSFKKLDPVLLWHRKKEK